MNCILRPPGGTRLGAPIGRLYNPDNNKKGGAMPLRCLLVIAVMAALPAFAHSDADAPAAGTLDCDHPPKDLARMLPKPVAGAATIVCTPSTQMISPHDGWTWRFPGSYFDRPSIPAYSHVESRGDASGRYFTKFEAKELSAGEIGKLHQKFTQSLATYPESKAPPRIVKLVARNDKGHVVDAYFGFKSKDEGWVAVCAPECAPEFFFLINRQQ